MSPLVISDSSSRADWGGGKGHGGGGYHPPLGEWVMRKGEEDVGAKDEWLRHGRRVTGNQANEGVANKHLWGT